MKPRLNRPRHRAPGGSYGGSGERLAVWAGDASDRDIRRAFLSLEWHQAFAVAAGDVKRRPWRAIVCWCSDMWLTRLGAVAHVFAGVRRNDRREDDVILLADVNVEEYRPPLRETA